MTHAVRRSNLFTTLDLQTCYKMDEESIPITAFIDDKELYEFTIPPETFLWYFKEHLSDITEVLKNVIMAQMKLKTTKCE